MSNLITLTCPSCGGQLEVTNDVDRFVCAHCGNAHLIDPSERAAALTKEVDQLRLKMDIRQVEDDLATLRERQSTIEAKLKAERDERKLILTLIWPLPIAVLVVGLSEGSSLEWTLLLALFLAGFLFCITWIIMSSDSPKKEKRELERMKKRIASGQQTLNFLQQELKRVGSSQQSTASS